MVKVISKIKDIDMIIHLGDLVKDALKLREQYKEIPVELVPGNNDWTREFTSEKILLLEGKKIFITHGHQYNVKYDYQRIISKGKSIKADAVFFGHTHIAEEMFSDGMLVLNPGSISIPHQSERPTYSLVEIRDNKVISMFGSPK
jgi:putative phosphoesterase